MPRNDNLASDPSSDGRQCLRFPSFSVGPKNHKAGADDGRCSGGGCCGCGLIARSFFLLERRVRDAALSCRVERARILIESRHVENVYSTPAGPISSPPSFTRSARITNTKARPSNPYTQHTHIRTQICKEELIREGPHICQVPPLSFQSFRERDNDRSHCFHR
jgi:hypothetical protein